MSEGERVTASLTGGGPWGLRLQGGKDFGAPLTIARVTPAGKADKSGAKPNDIITSINGTSTLAIPHIDAQQLVKGAGRNLTLELIRGRDVVAHPLSVPSSSASSASSSPGPASANKRPSAPWQLKPADTPSTQASTGGDLPPPPSFVTDSDTSGATSSSSTSPSVSHASTPSRVAPPWQQTAPGPQQQASPIPAEVASIASEKQANGDERRPSKEEDVVLGGTFRRLQQQVETMGVDDAPPASSLSPAASKLGATSSARQSLPASSPGGGFTSAAKRNSTPSTARPAAPAAAQSRASPSPSGGAKVNLAANLAKLQASDALQKAQKNALTDGGESRDDAAKRMSVSSGRVPVCGGCGEPIQGAFVQALGKQWHAEHFTCSSCASTLRNKPFVQHEGKMFCESCYADYFASRCSVCNKTITGECVSAGGKELHPKCFCCSRCGTSLAGTGFHEQDGNFYCSDDYEALFSIQCTGCELPVKNNELWVEALGGQWHEHCFVCTVCSSPLQGGKFFAKLGRPYCKAHA